MSVWYDYALEVLATGAAELDSIAHRLQQPSINLIEWAAERQGVKPSDCADSVAELVRFQPAYDTNNRDHGRFHNSFRNWVGLVQSHLYEVSAEFPDSAFLLNSGIDHSFSNSVIIAGELIAQSCDSNQHAQAIEWALVDVSAPFRAEHQSGLPFGTLWNRWLEDITAEVEEIRAADERRYLSLYGNKANRTDDVDVTCPEALDITFSDDVPPEVPRPTRPKHNIVREMRGGVWRTLCELCHEPIPVTTIQSEYDPEVPIGSPQCFEVTPCNVGLLKPRDEKPQEHLERWRKQPEKVVVCADCWSKWNVTGEASRPA